MAKIKVGSQVEQREWGALPALAGFLFRARSAVRLRIESKTGAIRAVGDS